MAATSLDQLTAADLPRRFGRYELQSILGEGGMAQVFGAELFGPAGFRKQVAVKVIKSEALNAGNCTTTWALIGQYTGPDTLSADFTATFTGSCGDCTNQSLPITATR